MATTAFEPVLPKPVSAALYERIRADAAVILYFPILTALGHSLFILCA